MENHPLGLSIRHVSKSYTNGRSAGAVQALKECIAGDSSRHVWAAGPNGAGKSTLMRTLATLQEPDEGQLFLGDIDIQPEGTVRRHWATSPGIRRLPQSQCRGTARLFAVLKGNMGRAAEKRNRPRHYSDKRIVKAQAEAGGLLRRHAATLWRGGGLTGQPQPVNRQRANGSDLAERVRFLNLFSELGKNGSDPFHAYCGRCLGAMYEHGHH